MERIEGLRSAYATLDARLGADLAALRADMDAGDALAYRQLAYLLPLLAAYIERELARTLDGATFEMLPGDGACRFPRIRLVDVAAECVP